ncbi:MAG: FtsQ-type POTRA domain-containing protein [Microbacteriaceae bacterium]
MKRPDLPAQHAKQAAQAQADANAATQAARSVKTAKPAKLAKATAPRKTRKSAAAEVADDPFVTEFGAAALSAPEIQPNATASAPKPAKPSKFAKSAKQGKPVDPARQARRDIHTARKRRSAELRAERRRFTAGRRRRRWMVITGVSVIATLFIGVFGVAYSPLMAVRTITVVGTSTLDAAAVQAALAPQLGTPLPLVDTDAIAKELAVFPAVQSFSTESIPPSTLVVRIVERTPIGSFERNGGFDQVDSAGVVIATAAEPFAGVPVLDVPDTAGEAFKTVSSMMLALTPELRAQASEAGATTASDAWFQISGGPQVTWGDASNAVLKLKVLQILLVQSGGSNEINVSAPNSPFTR